MQRYQTVALLERGRLATRFSTVLRQARRQPDWHAPDRRNLCTWRQFVLGVLVAHSTRLVTVSQALLGQRAAQSVKAVAMGLAHFLTVADFPAATLSPPVLEAAMRQLDPAQVATYRAKVVLALDPTEYPKRSRGRSKLGRHRQHVGRVRAPVRGGTTRRRPTAAARSPSCASKPSRCSNAWPCSGGASRWGSWPKPSAWTTRATAAPGPPSGSPEERSLGTGVPPLTFRRNPAYTSAPPQRAADNCIPHGDDRD